MKNIPEDLKNSKCCLKCELVDVDYAAKKLTGAPRTLYKCKKCNSYVKSYNEINTSGKQFLFIILMICAVIHFGEGSESINIDHLFTADVIVFLLFGLVWFHNCSNKKKLENFLQQHVERLERKAKEKEDAIAQYTLGRMYANGNGSPQDYAEAVKWFRKAAEQGHLDAQFTLGDLYSIGYGVPEDDVEAVKWWLKAAEQGHVPSQSNLGKAYLGGAGVQKDMAQATKWYRKAAEQGDADAKEWLKKNAKDKSQ